MSEKIHVLAQYLFNKPSLEECSLQEIRNLVHRYPYFAPAQFLLLEKLRQTDDPAYTTQLQRSILYYPDPLEFEYLIHSDQFFTADFIDTEPLAETGTSSESSEDLQTGAEPEPVVEPEPVQVEASVNTEAVPEPVPEIRMPQLEPVASGTALTFEPYHTVDYFASQGIKISEEEASKDRFGKQLKSFTEWLRTLKRLPATEAAPNIDNNIEKRVQHMAEISVNNTEVYTEAMAEIWLKQGNRSKALEVYKELCLLNPSKNAYFAAKIEQLKGS
jgi:hypothetical protein